VKRENKIKSTINDLDTNIVLNNLQMKPSDRITTYNIEFMRYTFQLDWDNNILCYKYYQRLLY